MDILDMTHDQILAAIKSGEIKPGSPEMESINLFIKQCEELLNTLKEEGTGNG